MNILLHLLKVDYAYQLDRSPQWYADGANEVAYINWMASTNDSYLVAVQDFEKSVGFKILADKVRSGEAKPSKPIVTSAALKKLLDQFTIWC